MELTLHQRPPAGKFLGWVASLQSDQCRAINVNADPVLPCPMRIMPREERRATRRIGFDAICPEPLVSEVRAQAGLAKRGAG